MSSCLLWINIEQGTARSTCGAHMNWRADVTGRSNTITTNSRRILLLTLQSKQTGRCSKSPAEARHVAWAREATNNWRK
jgi:hypothetical protein